MVVDDARVVRALLRVWLERMHIDVLEAAHVPAALQLLGETPVDAIITDIQMPGMSGLQLLEYVRSHAGLRDTPVITCSTLMEHHPKATAHLTKPIAHHALLAALVRANVAPQPPEKS
jgi:CheY-like chemotaxis protein